MDYSKVKTNELIELYTEISKFIEELEKQKSQVK